MVIYNLCFTTSYPTSSWLKNILTPPKQSWHFLVLNSCTWRILNVSQSDRKQIGRDMRWFFFVFFKSVPLASFNVHVHRAGQFPIDTQPLAPVSICSPSPYRRVLWCDRALRNRVLRGRGHAQWLPDWISWLYSSELLVGNGKCLVVVVNCGGPVNES